MKILVLNSGSSSQKACLYEIGDALPESPPLPLWEGRIEWNGDTAAITVRNSKGMAKKEKLKSLSLKSLSCELVLKELLATLWSGETRSIASAAEILVRNSKGMAKKEKLKSLSLKSLSCELVLKELLATLWSGETRSI